MYSRNSFSCVSGVVEQVSTSQKAFKKHRRGGWLIFQDIWFIVPSSTSIHSTAIQVVRLKTEGGERDITLVNETFPLHRGQRMTVVSLANVLVAYVNQSTGNTLKLNGNLERLAGRRPLSAFKSGLILFVIVFGILAIASGQEAFPHNPEIGAFWTLLAIPLLLALVILPVIGFCVGLVRNRKYRTRLSSIDNLVEGEMKLLLSKQ